MQSGDAAVQVVSVTSVELLNPSKRTLDVDLVATAGLEHDVRLVVQLVA